MEQYEWGKLGPVIKCEAMNPNDTLKLCDQRVSSLSFLVFKNKY